MHPLNPVEELTDSSLSFLQPPILFTMQRRLIVNYRFLKNILRMLRYLQNRNFIIGSAERIIFAKYLTMHIL